MKIRDIRLSDIIPQATSEEKERYQTLRKEMLDERGITDQPISLERFRTTSTSFPFEVDPSRQQYTS